MLALILLVGLPALNRVCLTILLVKQSSEHLCMDRTATASGNFVISAQREAASARPVSRGTGTLAGYAHPKRPSQAFDESDKSTKTGMSCANNVQQPLPRCLV